MRRFYMETGSGLASRQYLAFGRRVGQSAARAGTRSQPWHLHLPWMKIRGEKGCGFRI
jgi:hypothetical protein